MQVIEHKLKDVLEIIPDIYEDERGYFFESYNRESFRKIGIELEFSQDNQSLSQKNVLRGLHFQLPPKAMAKLVRVISGKILDVIVDLRKDSPTYLQYSKVIIDSDKKNMLLVPEGFAHGFLTLENDTIVSYKCSEIYDSDHDSALFWKEEKFGIDWEVSNPIVSIKDQNAMSWDKFVNPF